jgi:hypothetical protein
MKVTLNNNQVIFNETFNIIKLDFNLIKEYVKL